MFCHNCGTELEEGSAFCPECGTPQFDDPAPDHVHGGLQDEPSSSRPLESKDTVSEGSSRRFLIVIILIVILGIALGAGGFLLYQKMSSPSPGKAETAAGKDASSSQNSDKSGKDETASTKEADTDDGKADEKSTEEETPAPKEVTYIHEYTVVQGMRTWSDAKTYCEAQGGHLATAVSQDEYNQILAKANENGCVVLWIGGQRLQDGSFGWVTGEEFAFSAWAAGEPNNDGGSENCLGLMKVNGNWSMYDMPNDISAYYSSSKVGFIMEKDIAQ